MAYSLDKHVMETGISIGIGAVTLIIGYAISKMRFTSTKMAATQKAATMLTEAKENEAAIRKTTAENQHSAKKRLLDVENEVKERLETVKKRLDLLEKQDQKWEDRLSNMANQKNKISNELTESQEKITKLNGQELKELMVKTGENSESVLTELEAKYISEFQMDYEKFIQKSEYFTKEEAPKVARSILTSIMNRYSEPSSVDRLENNITVHQDKAKGRIIGKGGMNINYFEEKANVYVLFNDQGPEVITVSCFHLLRREIARIALTKLIKLNAIDEKAIDKALAEAKTEMDVQLEKIGKWAADIIDLPMDKRDPELLRLMGRLKYRTSYGQNILYHSLEIAFFSSMMASEIGADVDIARLGGFFHDLGKAIDQDDDVDKPHDYLSKELLEKFDFSWEIVHAAWTHHDAIPIETIEAELVKAADAISAGRPGARSESAEDYYARINALEAMAKDEKGVDKVFAMSAGRELRLYMNPDTIQDDEMPAIAAHLKNNIETNLSYPGKIKVNLIRQLTAVDYAKDKKL